MRSKSSLSDRWIGLTDSRRDRKATEMAASSHLRGRRLHGTRTSTSVNGVFILSWLFLDDEEPACLDAADTDDNREILILDLRLTAELVLGSL